MKEPTKKEIRAWNDDLKRKELKKKKIQRGNGCKTSILFGDTQISEGGWTNKWMTAKELYEAEIRWVKASYKTGEQESDYDHKNKWVPHQCGGCRTFAALDLDYGICCQIKSLNDGKITFEHGGCAFHSDLEADKY